MNLSQVRLRRASCSQFSVCPTRQTTEFRRGPGFRYTRPQQGPTDVPDMATARDGDGAAAEVPGCQVVQRRVAYVADACRLLQAMNARRVKIRRHIVLERNPS